MIKKYKEEYNNLTKNIINNEHFLMTKNDMHHGRTKYEHLVRVSKCAFVMSKIFKADTITCTTAGLLHDLFYGERTDSIENSYLNHPHTARNNAIKYFGVGDKVACAIQTHMFHHVILKKIFPFINREEEASIKFSKPKSKEAWIVSIADLLVSINDSKFFVKYKFNLAYLMLVSFILSK